MGEWTQAEETLTSGLALFQQLSLRATEGEVSLSLGNPALKCNLL